MKERIIASEPSVRRRLIHGKTKLFGTFDFVPRLEETRFGVLVVSIGGSEAMTERESDRSVIIACPPDRIGSMGLRAPPRKN